jgi:hypothetical protein
VLRKTSGAVSVFFMTLSAFAQQYNANDVTPVGPSAAKLTGAVNSKQVGGGSDGHAYLLNVQTAVDLHPPGFTSSMACPPTTLSNAAMPSPR